ncbi:MAG: cell division protein ZapD [Pseudomonadota bacterium]|nr:cell division protein ZapD [Pseudomonadota bacterium]
MTTNVATITFEQPLNEHIRLGLRLEHLFKQIEDNINCDGEWRSRFALSALLETLNVIDRPDIKTKFTKALSQQATTLAQLEGSPHVDQTALRQILNELDQLIDVLYTTPGKIGQNLRENDFLNTIRQYSYNPGGACNFSLPAYQLWLQQSKEIRIQSLTTWFDHFTHLRAAVRLLLQLIRSSGNNTIITAKEGFFQQALDPNLPCELVQVTLPAHSRIYPEISVGRHRMSVRFLEENVHERAKQVQRDIEFKLNCCTVREKDKG